MCGERRKFVTRGGCPSKVDEYDIYFLLDWAEHKLHIVETAFAAPREVNAAGVVEYICDPENDFPLSDALSVRAVHLKREVAVRLISCGASIPLGDRSRV